jgi:catechol 2,3-dioxygenase-like lactoylglutathione lyase family enzyme
MITKLSVVTIFVLDQDKAYEFYVNKLGFNVRTDSKMENGFRWLTVSTPSQPELEIALLTPLAGGMTYDEEARNAFRVLLEKGALGAGVMELRRSFVPRSASFVTFASRGYPRLPGQLRRAERQRDRVQIRAKGTVLWY